MSVTAPAAPRPFFSLGVTGHRTSNPTLAANMPAVRETLAGLFDQVDGVLAGLGRDLAPVRLHSLLVAGVDQVSAEVALARGWEVVAPLPFGQALNAAINAQPRSVEDARLLIRGEAAREPDVERRAAEIRSVAARAHLFELADRDDELAGLFLDALKSPDDFARARAFDTQCSDQVALAGRVMIERIDLLVAVWDGKISNLPGGTGHTTVTALEMGVPVLLIDPAQPTRWAMYVRPGELAQPGRECEGRLRTRVAEAVGAPTHAPFGEQPWRRASSPVWTLYRRIEAVFGGEPHPLRNLVAAYETPGAIASGSAAPLLAAAQALPRGDEHLAAGIAGTILPQFAWADGVSSWLSDAYRSGMCYNFVFAALAVIVGAAYLPFGLYDWKWVFASGELLLLALILAITFLGRRRRWHARWFEIRRVAEYLRHGPIMLLLGVARPSGRWPRSKGSDWPERFARNCLRSVGLPRSGLDRSQLRAVLSNVVAPHVNGQRDYHRLKARRLSNAHHRLDKLAGAFFVLAIVSVSIYLLLKLASVAGLLAPDRIAAFAGFFTFLGISFPTLGASIAGIRYFGDFERFAAISEVAAEKLDEVAARIDLLLVGPEASISYGRVAELAHALDAIVTDEIESWQAVFGGKVLALPA